MFEVLNISYDITVENRNFLISNTSKKFIERFNISLDSRQRGENSSGEIWEGEIEEWLQDSPRHEQPALGEKSGV